MFEGSNMNAFLHTVQIYRVGGPTCNRLKRPQPEFDDACVRYGVMLSRRTGRPVHCRGGQH